MNRLFSRLVRFFFLLLRFQFGLDGSLEIQLADDLLVGDDVEENDRGDTRGIHS